ncbi:hypothetical protein AS032_29590 [Rhodococcus qingshengii]|nr:hypothetical protein ABM90_18500 [Rhodococcus erythropolis]KSU69082.1 hypothetical protein AS032_29590 [Rhodococcus qingshengii]KZF15970.1 hypothetical protein A2J01_30165 [Rhodococcus sp. EPR-134]
MLTADTLVLHLISQPRAGPRTWGQDPSSGEATSCSQGRARESNSQRNTKSDLITLSTSSD